MNSSRGQYISGILKGLQNVTTEVIKLQEAECNRCWNNYIKTTICGTVSAISANIKAVSSNMESFQADKSLSEVVQRSSMVLEGIYAVVNYAYGEIKGNDTKYNISIPKEFAFNNTANSEGNSFSQIHKMDFHTNINGNKIENASVFSNTAVLEPEDWKFKCTDKTISKLEDNENGEPVSDTVENNSKYEYQTTAASNINNPVIGGTRNTHSSIKDSVPIIPPRAKKPPKKVPILNESAKPSTVPSSRIARVFSFGTLAAGLSIGTVAELTRRTLGISNGTTVGSALDNVFITPANAERIVNTLCKVRGAALKIGQILSIQDSSVISPEFQKMFERVRQSADFMPSWQVEKVLCSELGNDWRSKFASIDLKPFAAASIGQVHAGVLHDGREVAIKIQYPGVAKGIESDVDNLMSVLKLWNIFPKGMFIDNLVEVAKRELAWEVDYIREAYCTKKFKQLLKPYPEYFVPTVIDELSTSKVFTTELIEGIPVDKCADMDIKVRDRISILIMRLILREILEFQYMQTDPNWSNFFYNPDTKQLVLLDFGASREYNKEFTDQYLKVIKAAVDGDRKKVLQYSQKMGFLTGYESKIMEDAHVEAVMILGEVFSEDGFDFGAQNTTARIQSLVPTIIHHRLCPPPEEIYSLHRKLSGAFLLFSKLKIKLVCRNMFLEMHKNYRYDKE